jgi:hypothetical protein
VAYYDSLPQEWSRGDRLKEGCQGKDAPVIVASTETLAKWTTKKVRAAIEDVLERPIADYVPGSDKVKNKGGSGKKVLGRGMLVKRNINGRRAAKYPNAENQTMLWVKRMRGKGTKVTSRLTKAKMRLHVRQHHPGDAAALVFKASAGWLKRFMGRYRLTWRRRNDNATKSVDELMPSVAKFINDLRALRVSKPSVLVDNNPATLFDVRYGMYGPYNTLDVDQVPLPFASADPSTLEFIGTQRVWIKTPGSGLDKRQATLQLLIRALGKQPKPCLLFRGCPELKRQYDKDNRVREEAEYDDDVVVLWQAKAWADTKTCVKWAEGAFAEFVESELNGGESLVLADNLKSQVKDDFVEAVKAKNGLMVFGPKGATHVWQPVDHHIGREYGRLMGIYYDEWMAEQFDSIVGGHVSAGERRVLLTKWAGRAYRHLEQEREECEKAVLQDPSAEPSRFFKAFLRTGCLVTRDGTQDEEIRPHAHIKGDLLANFKRRIHSPQQLQRRVREQEQPEEQFVLQVSSSEDNSDDDDDDDSGSDWNSEDEDDEEVDSEDDEQEPVPDDMELEVEDEQAQVRAARAAAHKGGEERIRDFNMAARISRQQSVAVLPQFAGASDIGFNKRKNDIYATKVADLKLMKNREPTSREVEELFNAAGLEALLPVPGQGGEGAGDAPRRSARARRSRVSYM